MAAPALAMLTQVLVTVLRIVFRGLGTLVNVAIIQGSLGGLLVPDGAMGKINKALEAVLGPLAGIQDAFGNVFRLDLVVEAQYRVNCGGAILLGYMFFLVVGSIFLFVMLQKDLALRPNVWIKDYVVKSGASSGKKLLLTYLAGLVTLLLFVCLQLIIMVVFGSWKSMVNVKESCGATDAMFYSAGRLLIIFVMAGVILVYFVMFSGTRPERVETMHSLTLREMQEKNSTISVGVAILHIFRTGTKCGPLRLPSLRELWRRFSVLVLVTMGWWNDNVVRAFRVKEKAAKFDPDKGDGSSLHQELLSYNGQNKGLFWLPIPFLVFLVKVAEAANSPFVLQRTNEESLFIGEPKWRRVFKWGMNMANLGLTILIFWSATPTIAMAMLASVVPGPLLDLVMFFKDGGDDVAGSSAGGAAGGAASQAVKLQDDVPLAAVILPTISLDVLLSAFDKNKNLLEELVALQVEQTGHFELAQPLADVLDVPLADLESLPDAIANVPDATHAWATALAIAILRMYARPQGVKSDDESDAAAAKREAMNEELAPMLAAERSAALYLSGWHAHHFPTEVDAEQAEHVPPAPMNKV